MSTAPESIELQHLDVRADISAPASHPRGHHDQSSSLYSEPSSASVTMSQPAVELTPSRLLDILRLSTVVGESEMTSFITKQLARYSKFASLDVLHTMADMGCSNNFDASKIALLVRALARSQSDVAKLDLIKARIKEEGFPNFEMLPAELRTEIWKNALPGPRTIHIDPGTDSMATANTISSSSHTELFALRSVCMESFDVVRDRYQAIPFNNFALATSTTVKPHLDPARAANQFILVDLNHDVVHLEGVAVYNCITAWDERERIRRVFSLTKYTPEAGFNINTLSLSADSEIFRILIAKDYGTKWLTQFSALSKIVMVEVKQDRFFETLGITSSRSFSETLGMMPYRSFLKQLYLKIIWGGVEPGFVDSCALKGLELEFRGFEENKLAAVEIPIQILSGITDTLRDILSYWNRV